MHRRKVRRGRAQTHAMGEVESESSDDARVEQDHANCKIPLEKDNLTVISSCARALSPETFSRKGACLPVSLPNAMWSSDALREGGDRLDSIACFRPSDTEKLVVRVQDLWFTQHSCGHTFGRDSPYTISKTTEQILKGKGKDGGRDVITKMPVRAFIDDEKRIFCCGNRTLATLKYVDRYLRADGLQPLQVCIELDTRRCFHPVLRDIASTKGASKSIEIKVTKGVTVKCPEELTPELAKAKIHGPYNTLQDPTAQCRSSSAPGRSPGNYQCLFGRDMKSCMLDPARFGKPEGPEGDEDAAGWQAQRGVGESQPTKEGMAVELQLRKDGFGKFEFKKPMMDTASSFFIESVTSTAEARRKLLLAFGVGTQAVLDTWREHKGRDTSRPRCTFKGGVLLRFLLRNLAAKLSPVARSIAMSSINWFTQLSDLDFQVQHRLKHRQDISQLSVLLYVWLIRFRNWMSTPTIRASMFPFLAQSPPAITAGLQTLRTKFAETIADLKPHNFYSGCTVLHVSLDPERDFWVKTHVLSEGPWKHPNKVDKTAFYSFVFGYDRGDFAILKSDVPSEPTAEPEDDEVRILSAAALLHAYGLEEQVTKVLEQEKAQGAIFYATHNPLVTPEVPSGKSRHFGLNRIKMGVTVFLVKPFGGGFVYLRENWPAEVIDLSIEWDPKKPKEGLYVQDYAFSICPDVTVTAYNILGFMADLQKGVFSEFADRPWEGVEANSKVGKKIQRLCALAVLYTCIYRSGGLGEAVKILDAMRWAQTEAETAGGSTNPPNFYKTWRPDAFQMIMNAIIRSMTLQSTSIGAAAQAAAAERRRKYNAEIVKAWTRYVNICNISQAEGMSLWPPNMFEVTDETQTL